MAGLVPAIHVRRRIKGVDARDKPGHDGRDSGVDHCERSEAIQSLDTETVWIASSQELVAIVQVQQ
jgi:hypothetical protein